MKSSKNIASLYVSHGHQIDLSPSNDVGVVKSMNRNDKFSISETKSFHKNISSRKVDPLKKGIFTLVGKAFNFLRLVR